jgi:hypothetical protein
VRGAQQAATLQSWHVRSLSRVERGHRTVLRADLGLPLPLAALTAGATGQAFDREVTIAGSLDGRTFFPVGNGRLFHYPGASNGAFPLAGRARFVRVTIWNGDDVPLAGVHLGVQHEPQTLLVRGGGQPPYTARYGSALAPPSYDFARLPVSALGLGRASVATLGPEVVRVEASVDKPRSYRWLVGVGLAFAAIAVGAAAVLALRRTTPS